MWSPCRAFKQLDKLSSQPSAGRWWKRDVTSRTVSPFAVVLTPRFRAAGKLAWSWADRSRRCKWILRCERTGSVLPAYSAGKTGRQISLQWCVSVCMCVCVDDMCRAFFFCSSFLTWSWINAHGVRHAHMVIPHKLVTRCSCTLESSPVEKKLPPPLHPSSPYSPSRPPSEPPPPVDPSAPSFP